MQRIARFLVLFAVLALVSACGSRQFATGYPKDELVLSRLGNTVAVMFNGEVVQRVEVRGDFKFNMEIPVKASVGHGSTLRYSFGYNVCFLAVSSAKTSFMQSMCDMPGVVKCFEFDYMGVMVPCAITRFDDSAGVSFTLINADHHLLTVLYYERNITTYDKDSKEFEAFCNGILARALATFTVDVPALRMHMTPAKPEV